MMEKSVTRSFLMLVLLTIPSCCLAFGPLMQYNDLVAGEGDPGFEDGNFYSAQFNQPEGLALNEDGSILYVADRENNRVRAVDLNNENAVLTIAGTGKAGNLNGPISTATLNHPNCLAVLPGGQIAVGEEAGTKESLIRLIDLKTKTVTTLAGGGGSKADGPALEVRLSGLWNMAYRPSDQGLYFTEPGEGALRRLNLKTGWVETVLQNNGLIPNPMALCVSGDKLYVADEDLGLLHGQVFRLEGLENITEHSVDLNSNAPVTPTPGTPNFRVGLQPVGNARGAVALTGTPSDLYAYEGLPDPNSPSPILCLTAPSRSVTFVSVWGEPIANATSVMPYFKRMDAFRSVGFIADPRSEGRFYVTNPPNHLIAAFRDLEFASHLSDCQNFNYPQKKPFRTFRIFIVGRSYPCIQADCNYDGKGTPTTSYNTMTTFPAKLELELNTQAALDDVPVHFEVMNAHVVTSVPIWTWPYTVVPPFVKSRNIDLVLITVDPSQSDLEDFYLGPFTPDGRPPEEADPEFVLKPDSEKFAKEPLHSFFELCRNKKLLTVAEDKKWTLAPFSQLISDAEVEIKLISLVGASLGGLKKELDSILTSAGVPCRLGICYFFTPEMTYFPTKIDRRFWRDLCATTGMSFLDMTDIQLVTRLTYSPYSDVFSKGGHFSTDGHAFFGRLLAHELIRQNLIPFKKKDQDLLPK